MGNAQKVLIVTINRNGKKHKEMLYRKEDGGVFLKELSDEPIRYPQRLLFFRNI